MNIVQVLEILISSVFVLFIPGFALSFLFFSRGKIDLTERLALSFALSISSVPLIAFYANLIGIPIRRETVFIEVSLIIMSAVMGIVIKRELVKIKGKKEKTPS